MDYKKIIDLVCTAGKVVFDDKLKREVQVKKAADFVTAVDLKISTFLKEKLHEVTPDVAFMSEEEAGVPQGARWILDPIDGTTNLVYDYNMSSVSLAYFDGEKVDFGVIYNPYNEDLFVAKRGQGVWYNGEKLPLAPDRELADCLVEFGAGSTVKENAAVSFALAQQVFENCLDLRRICSSALAIAYIAAGKLNGYFEKVLKPWDYAAASLMLEEAGGVITDWEGKPVSFTSPSSIVCGTPKAYAFLKDIVEKAE